jgi:hypothetical protein
MSHPTREGSISARAKNPVEIIDPLNDPDFPPHEGLNYYEGLRYLSERYGITTKIIRPIRSDPTDKRRMINLIKFEKTMDALWNVYWIGRDAKGMNKLFMETNILCRKFVGFATNVDILINMKLIWEALKTQITEKKLMLLGRLPKKSATEEQIRKTKELHANMKRIYRENP